MRKQGQPRLFIKFALIFVFLIAGSRNALCLVWDGSDSSSSTCTACQEQNEAAIHKKDALIQAEVESKVKSLKDGDIIGFEGRKWLVKRTEKSRLYLCPYHSRGDFYENGNWGWFYGEECRWVEANVLVQKLTRERKNKAEHSIYREIPWDRLTDEKYLSHLTAPEFRRLFSRVREAAVMEPTQQHIAAYTYMTDFMRRKAVKFMYAVDSYLLENPVFDMRRRGTSGWAHRITIVQEEKDMDSLFHRVSKDAGVYFFVSGGCPYCKKETRMVQWLAADYGFTVITVSRDFCTADYPNCMVRPDLFRSFSIQYTPTIIFIYRHKEKPHIMPVAVGLTTYDIIKNRIYTFLRQIIHGAPENDLLPPQQRQTLLQTNYSF